MDGDKGTLDCAVALAGRMIDQGEKDAKKISAAIETLFDTLRGLQGERLAARDKTAGKVGKLTPALDVGEHKGQEWRFVPCLECGAKVKDLTAHLQKKHGLVWAAYKDKWEGYAAAQGFELLKVSGALSAKRSDTAKANGLGQAGKEDEEPESVEPVDILTLLERVGEALAKNPRRRAALSNVARAGGFADNGVLRQAIGAGFNSLCGLITIEDEEGGKSWVKLNALQA